ncbi:MULTISPECIES: hypothetical protein [unclassified Peribacillus]|uniref:hypothetical protein n=1 Tax=unclassified Peribacillus TaxID=2675266 RepID=UPI00191349B3|nr:MULTISPECIES: hypothetical protein [unclassified Peribacillus]MBK5441519.1 hypothetical protein [Peribacillus sp. TH24]MBK5501961.1 hypothetical protein [Peribacillus sp. TH14]
MQEQAEEGNLSQPYIDDSGTFIKFDDVKALEDGLPLELVQNTKEDYDKANAYLAKQQPKFFIQAKANCGGTNKFVGNIVAGTVYVDSCKTNKIIAIIAGGGGASSLVALLPGGAAIAVVAVAIYTIGGAVISYNAADGNGIKIKILKKPITGKVYSYWVKPQ